MKKIGIVMGSDSDLPIIKKATDLLRTLEIPFEVHVYSAHRTPEEARNFARSARENGFGVLIAAAGMAAHLAGAIAANTTLPVIGIPCKSAAFGGIDALLSTVQMPTGIPVATVAVDGGANAALLAAQILAWRMRPWPKSWTPSGRRTLRRCWKKTPPFWNDFNSTGRKERTYEHPIQIRFLRSCRCGHYRRIPGRGADEAAHC